MEMYPNGVAPWDRIHRINGANSTPPNPFCEEDSRSTLPTDKAFWPISLPVDNICIFVVCVALKPWPFVSGKKER
jgi:hypothetical protein